MVGKTPSSIKAQVKYLESTPVSIQTLQRCVCDILQKRGDDSNIVYCIFYEIVSQEFPGVANPLEISNNLSMRQNMMRPSWQPPKNFACLLSFFRDFSRAVGIARAQDEDGEKTQGAFLATCPFQSASIVSSLLADLPPPLSKQYK